MATIPVAKVSANEPVANAPVQATVPAPAPGEELRLTQEKLAATAAELERMRLENDWLRGRLLLAKNARYGASSEKTATELIALTAGQASLFDHIVSEAVFDEAEAVLQGVPEVPEPTAETAPKRVAKDGKGGRLVQIADLPIEEVRHELPAGQCQCAQCQGLLHIVKEEVRDILEMEPPRFKIVRHIRPLYACRACEKSARSGQGEPMAPVLAPFCVPLVPGLMASPNLVAYIMSQKYELGLPLYRLQQYFGARGLDFSRQTLANWMMAGAEWLTPLFLHMRRFLLEQDVLHADETTLQVLREKDREAQTKSYMWVYCTSREGPPLVLYDYRRTRGGEHPARFLRGFSGYLHVDGWEAYATLPGVKTGSVQLAGCWAHARRKFNEALTALPKDVSKSAKASSPEYKGLEFCNALFTIERQTQGMTPTERLKYRNLHSRPVLDRLHTWLQSLALGAFRNAHLQTAVGYCLKQWSKLTTFLLDGRLEIDNNRIERAVKPFVIGRKNWLFANVPDGATSSAIIYSLVESAKLNDLVPQDYLALLLGKMPHIANGDTAALDQLMPWHPVVKEQCAKAASKRKAPPN